MSPEDRFAIRELHYVACRGRSDGLKRIARGRLERIIDEAGLDERLLFDELGLDLGAWFASRPASKENR